MSRKDQANEKIRSHLSIKKPLLSMKRLITTRPPSTKKNKKEAAKLNKTENKIQPLIEITSKNENKQQPERSLIDSFESYYESEEENMDKLGKTQLSYQLYKESHEKGSRRREKLLMEKVQEVKKENSLLKLKLKKLIKKKKASLSCKRKLRTARKRSVK